MLVLSRKENERIALYQGDQLFGTITLVQLRGCQARIGLEFPDHIEIVRTEVKLERDQTPCQGSTLARPGKVSLPVIEPPGDSVQALAEAETPSRQAVA